MINYNIIQDLGELFSLFNKVYADSKAFYPDKNKTEAPKTKSDS